MTFNIKTREVEVCISGCNTQCNVWVGFALHHSCSLVVPPEYIPCVIAIFHFIVLFSDQTLFFLPAGAQDAFPKSQKLNYESWVRECAEALWRTATWICCVRHSPRAVSITELALLTLKHNIFEINWPKWYTFKNSILLLPRTPTSVVAFFTISNGRENITILLSCTAFRRKSLWTLKLTEQFMWKYLRMFGQKDIMKILCCLALAKLSKNRN